jgi:hypothetical protein
MAWPRVAVTSSIECRAAYLQQSKSKSQVVLKPQELRACSRYGSCRSHHFAIRKIPELIAKPLT